MKQPAAMRLSEPETSAVRGEASLAERLPNSELIPLYPDAGHGGIFQYHEEFVPKALEFLTA
jgi:hypothetical protein